MAAARHGPSDRGGVHQDRRAELLVVGPQKFPNITDRTSALRQARAARAGLGPRPWPVRFLFSQKSSQ